jgi:hypothetical protein
VHHHGVSRDAKGLYSQDNAHHVIVCITLKPKLVSYTCAQSEEEEEEEWEWEQDEDEDTSY